MNKQQTFQLLKYTALVETDALKSSVQMKTRQLSLLMKDRPISFLDER